MGSSHPDGGDERRSGDASHVQQPSYADPPSKVQPTWDTTWPQIVASADISPPKQFDVQVGQNPKVVVVGPTRY
jgi:hypothetical protein